MTEYEHGPDAYRDPTTCTNPCHGKIAALNRFLLPFIRRVMPNRIGDEIIDDTPEPRLTHCPDCGVSLGVQGRYGSGDCWDGDIGDGGDGGGGGGGE